MVKDDMLSVSSTGTTGLLNDSGYNWTVGEESIVHIPIEKFGQDHWSAFLFAEACAVDFSGVLDDVQMRTRKYEGENYPTRLKDGTFVEDAYHDDYSCMEDLQYAGLLERPEYQPNDTRTIIRLTDYGWYVAGLLRRWKAEGNKVGEFVAPTGMN